MGTQGVLYTVPYRYAMGTPWFSRSRNRLTRVARNLPSRRYVSYYTVMCC